MSTILEVEDLRVAFPSRQGPVEVVRRVTFDLGLDLAEGVRQRAVVADHADPVSHVLCPE